jgi:hypothetical protein
MVTLLSSTDGYNTMVVPYTSKFGRMSTQVLTLSLAAQPSPASPWATTPAPAQGVGLNCCSSKRITNETHANALNAAGSDHG